MPDITSTHLEAAIIDQMVAGQFSGTAYVFVPVCAEGDWQLGVAVANESGYSPVWGKTFDTQAEAKQWAEGLNAHIGRSPDIVSAIVISTMGGQSFIDAPS
jgi:hypothetical protein